MDQDNQYYPFTLSNHEKIFSLLLTDLKWDLFEKNSFLGNGHDWNRFIENLLRDKLPNILPNLEFDSEADMFCVRSEDKSQLEKIATLIAPLYDNESALEAHIVKYAQ